MNIAYLCADRGVPVGGTKGASIHVRGVVRALAARGHQVRVLAVRREAGGRDPGVPVLDVGFDRPLKRLARTLKKQGGDTALTREVHAMLLNGRISEALLDLDRCQPVDAVYERYSLWSCAGLRFARSHAVPWILEVNAPLVDEQKTYRDLHLVPVARALERTLLQEADLVLVPSEPLKAHVQQRAGRSGPVLVMANGVDLDLFRHPPMLPPPGIRQRLEKRFVVAFIGSLKPWHGIPTLLEAFARLRRRVKEAHLLVIGDGPLADEVRRVAAAGGAVTCTGSIPHEEVPGWLASADVGVAPYPELDDFYFSPLKIMEYLAAGLPVVASDIGQIPSLVQHERTGLLVPPDDARALAGALTRLHAHPLWRARLARRAQARAFRRHGWDRVAARVEGALERIAARKGRLAAGPVAAIETGPS